MKMNTSEVSHAARASAPLRSLLRVCFEPCDEFLQILRGHVLPRNDHQRETCEEGDRLEITHDVVLEIVQSAIGNMRVPEAQTDRVAIRSRTGDAADSNAAVRSAHVFNDDRLTKRCSHPLGEN